VGQRDDSMRLERRVRLLELPYSRPHGSSNLSLLCGMALEHGNDVEERTSHGSAARLAAHGSYAGVDLAPRICTVEAFHARIHILAGGLVFQDTVVVSPVKPVVTARTQGGCPA